MKNKKSNKNISVVNLVCGYMMAIGFVVLLVLSVNDKKKPITTITRVIEVNNTIVNEKIVYTPSPVIATRYTDHLNSHDRIVDDEPTHVVPTFNDSIGFIPADAHVRTVTNHRNDDLHHVEGASVRVKRDRGDVDHVDLSLLDRRIAQQQVERERPSPRDFGVDVNGVNITNLTVDRSEAESLDDLNVDIEFDNNKNGAFGVNNGELYAYNFPSRGVGAGVGNGAVGAGAGGGAGLGAGIGEATHKGEAVPALGGVGTYIDAETSGPAGGVGGLSGGAAAGGAAGLMTGMVDVMLGTGPLTGAGAGGYNYDHLPQDGALHIMMHVDGSGSILNTRKQLNIMKDTLLKDVLLPYYNNDVDLYNQRVTVISTAGERTLQFFKEAAGKNNVLAVAFQDEAQPAYHLPNFNKKPEAHYLKDIADLEVSLDGYPGLYRGVMFQVDRGATFAKSFKEFVNNSFRGEGYLMNHNLKKYYRDNNVDNIRNKNGVVFSDEYHAKDSGDPSYYLNLILSASKRVGLDLNVNNGGLTDGKSI